MNKETERWIIIILLVMLLVAGLSGCAGNTKKAESTQPSVFDGSLSRMIGCILLQSLAKAQLLTLFGSKLSQNNQPLPIARP